MRPAPLGAFGIAEELALPMSRISLEMVFRGLYHFHHAYSSGQATDPVLYLAAPENRDLGVVKAVRKRKGKPKAHARFVSLSCRLCPC